MSKKLFIMMALLIVLMIIAGAGRAGYNLFGYNDTLQFGCGIEYKRINKNVYYDVNTMNVVLWVGGRTMCPYLDVDGHQYKYDETNDRITTDKEPATDIDTKLPEHGVCSLREESITGYVINEETHGYLLDPETEGYTYDISNFKDFKAVYDTEEEAEAIIKTLSDGKYSIRKFSEDITYKTEDLYLEKDPDIDYNITVYN